MKFPKLKRLLQSTGIAMTLLSGAQVAQAQDSLSEPQKSEVEGVIEQYLMENPDVLLRAIQNVQIWQATETARQQAEAITPVWDALVADSTVPQTGALGAPVTVIEFFDYHCGYCKRVFDEVTEITKNSDGKVRTIYVEFPILREESVTAARAALAAAKQDKYIETHRAFMGNRGVLDNDRIDELAAGAGVDVDQMRKDMQSQEITDMLAQYQAMAQAIGVNGTPAFLINGAMVSGANMERVNELIEAGLHEAS